RGSRLDVEPGAAAQVLRPLRPAARVGHEHLRVRREVGGAERELRPPLVLLVRLEIELQLAVVAALDVGGPAETEHAAFGLERAESEREARGRRRARREPLRLRLLLG